MGRKGQPMSTLYDKDFQAGTRVLVAEDDLVTRMMLKATLEDWGLEVEEAQQDFNIFLQSVREMSF